MALEIQERDTRILKFVFACKVASYPQIVQRCFSGCDKSIAYRRIRKLCKDGFLKPFVATNHELEIKYVETTEKAWKAIREQWSFEIDRPHYRSESPLHDLRLNEIFFSLEKLASFRSFYTENLLQSSSALAQEPNLRDLAKFQADGALTIAGRENRSYTYGVELEISKKIPDRYREKLASYYMARKISGVIYICSEREILNSLAQVDAEIRGEKKSILFLGLEDEVLKANGKMYFKNAKEQGIELI
jgi:DNA-binding PadR family transcriptional regulator